MFGLVTRPRARLKSFNFWSFFMFHFPSTGSNPSIDRMKESLIFDQLNYAEFTDKVQHTLPPP